MVGKLVFEDLYLHVTARDHFPTEHRQQLEHVLQQAPEEVNVIRLNRRTGDLRLLAYQDFDSDPFPALRASWRVEESSSILQLRSYKDSLNPPILHRKELLVPTTYPLRKQWVELTTQAEELGLFSTTNSIGFKLNWERLVESRGYRVTANGFAPIANEEASVAETPIVVGSERVQRHLTALSRSNLSAPVQLLLRHDLLPDGTTFLDYGCGRGDDVNTLQQAGYSATGWDPHYSPNAPLTDADVVNLGFVINVIEDPAERIDALTRAFSLARQLLAVGVMLHIANDGLGRRFGDGVITSRGTFQKYFTQDELKSFLEDALLRPAYAVAPGIAFVFKDRDLEQRFEASRYRRRDLAQRLLAQNRFGGRRKEAKPRIARTSTPRRDKQAERLAALRPWLDELWRRALELGRFPEAEEVSAPSEDQNLSNARLRRLLSTYYDMGLLQKAAEGRKEDVLVFLASQEFAKRPPFRALETRLQRDIKYFFGDYARGRQAAFSLLRDTGDSEQLLDACKEAAGNGFGLLDDEHSLQIHFGLIDRLPALLRAYVICGLTLWDSSADIDIVKIHIQSAKLTLLKYDDFATDPVPLLKRRVKVNLRKLDYDVFEYGSARYPKRVLLWKSRFLNEESECYAEQLAFDEGLERLKVCATTEADILPAELESRLEKMRWRIAGMSLVRSSELPELDAECGANFRFGNLIVCGETQERTALPNTPKDPESYNALHDLAVNILDPVIEYFGAIKLTYGFCSPELAREIEGRIDPSRDQHAALERNSNGKRICSRGGAACDFLVEDEDMFEVARWIMDHLPFDRIYVYERDRPIHVSYGPAQAGEAYQMVLTSSGRRVPRPFRSLG